MYRPTTAGSTCSTCSTQAVQRCSSCSPGPSSRAREDTGGQAPLTESWPTRSNRPEGAPRGPRRNNPRAREVGEFEGALTCRLDFAHPPRGRSFSAIAALCPRTCPGSHMSKGLPRSPMRDDLTAATTLRRGPALCDLRSRARRVTRRRARSAAGAGTRVRSVRTSTDPSPDRRPPEAKPSCASTTCSRI